VRELANAPSGMRWGWIRRTSRLPAGQSLGEQMEAFEAQCLRAALRQHKGEIKAVMEALQLPRRTLNEKMQRHGLVREDFVGSE
jgi:two-component system C4-dicarboxylate transport response regulator DctD